MNKFFSFLLLSLVLCGCKHDLGAATFATYTPGAAVRGINRQVWIAFRTDGRAGLGTADDPFDGSTAAKFDAVLQALKADSYELHIGPGTFTTRGTRDNAQFTAGKSYKITGDGIGVTTLQLASGTYPDTASTDTAIFRQWDFYGDLEYFELGGMSLDCNPTGQPIYSGSNNADLGAVVVCTRQSWLHDLDISGVWSRGGETFPVCPHSTLGNAVTLHHVIERVKVVPAGGYMTALALINQQGGTNRLSGVIRDCLVIGDGNHTPGVGQNGIGAGGWDGVKVENNRLAGLVSGVVIDNLNYRNVTFSGNAFTNCAYGIAYNGGGTYDGIYILNNTFGPASGSTALLPAAGVLNELILGNTFETDSIGTTNAVTGTELNYLRGLTSPVQAQLDAGGGGGLAAGAVVTNLNAYGTGASSLDAGYYFTNSGGAANEKRWHIGLGSAGTFTINPLSDAGIYMTPLLQSYQNGTSIDTLDITVTNILNVTAPRAKFSGTVRAGGYTNFNATANTLIYNDANKGQASVTIGTGLSFTGGTLSATGGGAGPVLKAQVVFDNTGAIRSSYNVTSVTLNGTGDYTVNFTAALTSTNYAAQLSGRGNPANPPPVFVENYDNITRTTSALRLYSLTSTTGAPTGVPYYSVTIFE